MADTKDRCYRCGAEATSKDHVPPKCLFPTAKEADGVDHRANLITVPSCDEHNLMKSSDDQFLLLSLARIVGNNDVGKKLGNGKVLRSLKRTPHIINSIFKELRNFVIERDGIKIDFTFGIPDFKRLQTSFEKIFYGLYYHHFGRVFNGEIRIFLSFLTYTDPEMNNYKDLIERAARKELKNKPRLGLNQKVFYFQFADPDQNGIVLCKTVYYDNVTVYAAFGKQEPNDLVSLLLRSGIQTCIEADGRCYIFNKK